jgi:hypothetical protein
MTPVDIFIAVIIVIILMNGFLFVVFKGIVTNVGKLAQNNAVRQLSVYDELIEAREKKLEGLQSTIAAQKVQVSPDCATGPSSDNRAPVPSFTMPEGDYIDMGFLPNYRMIRESFGVNCSQLIKTVIENNAEKGKASYLALVLQILDRFPLEQRFSLSTLPEDKQLSILKEVLESQQVILLEEYQAVYDVFDCLEFFAWLEEEACRYNQHIFVRTCRQDEDFMKVGNMDRRIKIQYDNSICEGVQIIMRNKLYDYSILKREIS